MLVKGFFFLLISIGLLTKSCGPVPKRVHLQNTDFKTAHQQQNKVTSYILAIRKKNTQNQEKKLSLAYKNHQSALTKLPNSPKVKTFNLIFSLPANFKQIKTKKKNSRFSLDTDIHEKNRSHSSIEIIELNFTDENSAKEEIEILRQNENLLFIEPNHKNRIYLDRDRNNKTSPIITSLNLYQKNDFFWWQKTIKFHQSIKFLKENLNLLTPNDTKHSPVIAVLDSGIDYKHPMLKKSIWLNPLAGQTKCGYDLHGCNTTKATQEKLGTPDVFPYGTNAANAPCGSDASNYDETLEMECSHGTHIAGIIVGQSDYNMIGLCPLCKLMTLKIIENIDGEALVSDSSILYALKYIALVNQKLKNPIRIINASFGKFEKSKAISLLLYYLRKTYQTLTIAAAGNENTNKAVYPGALKHVFSVAALNYLGQKASYSNYGHWVNILAPGGDSSFEYSSLAEYNILSSAPGNKLILSQGTSVAVPIVAGTAGFFLSINPQITADELENILSQAPNDKESDKFNLQLNKTVKALDVKESLKYLLDKKHKNTLTKKRIEPVCGYTITPGEPKKPFAKHFAIWLLFLLPLVFILQIEFGGAKDNRHKYVK